MKNLRKYNELFDTGQKIFDQISDYRSDVILDVNQIGFELDKPQNDVESDGMSLLAEFEIFYVDKSRGILQIRAGVYGRYRFFLNGSIIGTKSNQYDFSLSDWKSVFKLIEEKFIASKEADRKISIAKEMIKVITKKIIEDYFAELIDMSMSHKIYPVEYMSGYDQIGWGIEIDMSNNLVTYGKLMEFNDEFIEITDDVISAVKRIKDLYDIIVTYRYIDSKLYIYILADDGDHNPIGIGLIK